MKFSQILSVASLASSVAALQNSTSTNVTSSEKRYAILDNDWSPAGFIPFLIALKGGMEVLALTSCMFSPNLVSPNSERRILANK